MTENGEHVKIEMKIAEVLNSFFSNKAKNLKIPQYSSFDPKGIVNYKNHSCIPIIQAKYKGKIKFSFTEVTTQYIEKDIFDLKTKKIIKFLIYQQRLLTLTYLRPFYVLVIIVLLNIFLFP